MPRTRTVVVPSRLARHYNNALLVQYCYFRWRECFHSNEKTVNIHLIHTITTFFLLVLYTLEKASTSALAFKLCITAVSSAVSFVGCYLFTQDITLVMKRTEQYYLFGDLTKGVHLFIFPTTIALMGKDSQSVIRDTRIRFDCEILTH